MWTNIKRILHKLDTTSTYDIYKEFMSWQADRGFAAQVAGRRQPERQPAMSSHRNLLR